jgi:dTDP-4-dehydrorhamnose 3,5-epimerase-like enzyme
VKITKIKTATSDSRGDIADIFYKHPIDHVAIINSKKGSFRGDHYHKFTTQHMYMIHGSLRYYYRKTKEGGNLVKNIVVKQGEMVTTPPYEVHALEILEDNQFIVFSEGKRGGKDYESDTFRVKPTLISKNKPSFSANEKS